MAVTDNAAPELKPKRPHYTTYNEIIRTLFAAAQSRIRQDKQPDPVPPVPNNRTVRRLASQYAKHRKLARKAEAALSNLNLQVQDSGTVRWSYSYTNRLNEKPGAARQKRMDAIQQLRVKATVDTMDMTPAQAKTYLLALERRLARV